MLHLKKKYIDMLMSMWGGYSQDNRLSFSGKMKDSEGEEINVSYGYSIPYVENSSHLDWVSLEFIPSSLFLKAKKEKKEIPLLDDAILSIIKRRKVPQIQLEVSHDAPFVRIANLESTYHPDYLDFYYNEFALYIVGAYNSFFRILTELKGKTLPSTEEQIVHGKQPIYYLNLDDVRFDKEYFLSQYRKYLTDYVDGVEYDCNNEIHYLVCCGYTSEELNEEDKKAKEKISETKRLADAEYGVLTELLGIQL